MVGQDSADVDFVEVFPIPPGTAPTLTAYEAMVGGEEAYLVGGKLAYRLGKQFPGHWVWTGGRIVTDQPQEDGAIKSAVEALWREQPETYRDLRQVQCDIRWRPTAQARADFVARGLFRDIERDIRRLLEGHVQDLGPARVERVYEVRGWVVDGRSAISVSIASRLVLKQDLAEYSRTSEPRELLGLWVGDKRSTGKGEVIEIVGSLGDHRARLLSISQEEETLELLRSAPDDEVVVRVAFGRNEYDYTASALRVILRTTEFLRFGVNASAATRSLRLEPRARADIVRDVANLAKARGFIADGYNSRSHGHLFRRAPELGFKPALCFGGGVSREYREADLWRNLRVHGLYKLSNLYRGRKIRVGVLLQGASPSDKEVLQLLSQLGEIGVTADMASSLRIADLSRASLESAIEELTRNEPDIVLAILPEDVGEDEEEWGAYHNLKSVTVGRGIPSQVVYQGTLGRRYAFANIAMGILGKTGSVPFVLADPLPYADMVVGLDIARERKQRLAGSLNATAVARIYFGNGEFLRYVIHDAPLEGETIPGHVLQGLFPLAEFRDKRVVIHRDGYFRGDEKRVLQDWARDIGAEFNLVEVLKTGTPRAYRTEGRSITQPEKGLLFRLTDREAFLVSSLPPFRNATPQPLQLRTEPPFTIEQAAHSVLSMTLLHYGSLRPPRLPVTIHYSDRIAYLALRGIKPRQLEGTIPYWL